MEHRILTINGGSSTIKFAVFRANATPEPVLRGQVDGIGRSGAALTATDIPLGETRHVKLAAADHREAACSLMDWIAASGAEGFDAIGHRVVHGGPRLASHQRLTPPVLEELRRAQPLDLAHLPREIALVEAFRERFPTVAQFACFDTVFHRSLPHLSQILPIPRRYFNAGIRKLGFHGLSYSYLIQELRRIAGSAADGRVILAHLGSGSSMTALLNGAPVDTTMAFTPVSGMMMGTRPGDLDPGLLVYVMRAEKFTPEQIDEFVNARCGLAGVSESTSDMRELLSRRAGDERARDAVGLFCYQARKWIGAFAAVLGGVDTIVFSGGIGERSPEVRSGICEGFGLLGLQLDPRRNAACAGDTAVISSADSAVTVRVILTDEELMIARIVFDLLAGGE